MRLLVYEHVSGGGFADEPLPAGVLSEGFAMLKTLTKDFKAAGHSVAITLDSRIAKLNPPIPADRAVPVTSSCETQAKLHMLSEQADAAYVIAPETDGVLQSLVEMVEQTGVTSLNCESGAIAKVSDKAKFPEFIKALVVPLPETMPFSVNDGVKEIAESVQGDLGFPVVFKPVDGVSCEGVSVVRNKEQVAGAVSKVKAESSDKRFLVQKLIEGAAASVSLFSTGRSVIPVSLNRQDVKLETAKATSSYRGGVVPFDHPMGAEAFEAAKKILEAVPGLRGYVGVDFVLTGEEAVAIEVNPRLTTSYVGLRRAVNFNLAQAIIDSVLKHSLPEHVERCGYTVFSKVETYSPTVDTLQELYEWDEVVSPPFPVSHDGASALVASYGETFRDASRGFREAKKRVLDIINRGGQRW